MGDFLSKGKMSKSRLKISSEDLKKLAATETQNEIKKVENDYFNTRGSKQRTAEQQVNNTKNLMNPVRYNEENYDDDDDGDDGDDNDSSFNRDEGKYEQQGDPNNRRDNRDKKRSKEPDNKNLDRQNNKNPTSPTANDMAKQTAEKSAEQTSKMAARDASKSVAKTAAKTAGKAAAKTAGTAAASAAGTAATAAGAGIAATAPVWIVVLSVTVGLLSILAIFTYTVGDQKVKQGTESFKSVLEKTTGENNEKKSSILLNNSEVKSVYKEYMKLISIAIGTDKLAKAQITEYERQEWVERWRIKR